MPRYIDADKLKWVLDHNFGHTGGAAVLAQLIDNAPTIEAVEVWVSVEDGLPETPGQYLVTNGKSVYIMPLVENGVGKLYWMAGYRWQKKTQDVTHWMPLPEPPKMREDAT